MKRVMNRKSSFCLASAVLLVSLMASAQEQGVVRPCDCDARNCPGMPKARSRKSASPNELQPRDYDAVPYHRFPVTVYVLEGVFTMEMEGRGAITVKAGEAAMMPPHVNMTGHNRSNSDPCGWSPYVSDPTRRFSIPYSLAEPRSFGERVGVGVGGRNRRRAAGDGAGSGSACARSRCAVRAAELADSAQRLGLAATPVGIEMRAPRAGAPRRPSRSRSDRRSVRLSRAAAKGCDPR